MAPGNAVTLLATLTVVGTQALAADTLVAGLLARAPASSGESTMSALALEACLREADKLDRDGAAIADESAAIERLTAERQALQNQINAELDQLSHYNANEMAAFERRVAHNDEIERRLGTGGPANRKARQAHGEAVADYKKNCSGAFAAGDLTAVKARLGLQ